MIAIEKLEIPCSYQGGKHRLAKGIVDIFFNFNSINDDTKFYDLCCGSGAVSLELINRGVHPNNIVMVDNGGMGAFWKNIAVCDFDIKEFRDEINKLPVVENIQNYLRQLSEQPVDDGKYVYHYLLLQAGAFGSKQIWIDNGAWKNNTFRSYWMPTATSNRRSHVNPMMPMPETLYKRVVKIVDELGGCIKGLHDDVFQVLPSIFSDLKSTNAIVYIDPPYENTTGYKSKFDVMELVEAIRNINIASSVLPIYVSEGYVMANANWTYLLSSGRQKGNVSGSVKKKPVEEWLNKF